MKQVYTVSYDNDYLQRKLDHYNKWLLDPKRDFGSTYPGFPEEIQLEKARKSLAESVVAKSEAKVKKVVAGSKVIAVRGVVPY